MPEAPTIADDGFGTPAEARRLAEELLPLLYEDVRLLARRERRRVNAGGTMQTTALVHEAYLKLLSAARFNDRQHFLRAAALAMRHILINHARDRVVEKRGGGARHVGLDDVEEIGITEATALLEVNDALSRLGQMSPRLAQDEILSLPATDWAVAKEAALVREEGPQITQAGGANYRSVALSVGFAGHPAAWNHHEVRFFAHAVANGD